MTAETGETWKSTLEEIVRFIKEHGRLPSKNNRNDPEKRLAHWRHHNCSLHHRGLLSEDRAQSIESSGILPNKDDRIWLNMLERTKKFVALYGRYPSRFGKSKEEKKCGRWRSDQAALFNGNRLQPDRKQLFENAGLTDNVIERNWNRMLKMIVQFKKKHGRMPSATSSKPEELKLANWRNKNILAIKANPSANMRRATLLQAAGITEKRKHVDNWQIQYDKLKAFCAEHSRLPLYGSAGAEKSLYQWYFDQKTRIKKGKLNFEQISKIETIKRTMTPPGKVARDLKWMNRYGKVDDFIHTHNRLPSSSKKNIKECKLNRWLQEQKKAIRKGALEPKYLKLLERCYRVINMKNAPEDRR